MFPLSQDNGLKYLGNVNTEIFRDLKRVGYLLTRRERTEDYHPNNVDIGLYLPATSRPQLKESFAIYHETVDLLISRASLIYF